MNYHQSYVLLQDCGKFFSSLVQPFYSSFRSLSTIHGGVSQLLSQHLKTEEEFLLQILSVLSKMWSSSLMPSSHNCFRLWQFFSPIRSISGVFSVWFSEGHHFGLIHSQLSTLILQILLVHHSIFSNQLVISSFQLYLNPLKYPHSFSNSYRWFIPLLRSFANSYRWCIPSLRSFFNSTGGS